MHTAQLYEELNWSRRETELLLNQLDLDAKLYNGSKWCVKDVIAHLTAWEEESLKSLEAYHQGAEYCIADYTDVDDFNARQYKQRENLSGEAIIAQWMEIRRQIVSRLYRFTTAQWQGELLDPKGRCISVLSFIKVLIDHEAEHRMEMSGLLLDSIVDMSS